MDPFVDNSSASSSADAIPAVETQESVDIAHVPLLQTTSKHAYQVIRTKLWKLRHEKGKKPREELLDDVGRSTKRRKGTTASVVPNLIQKFGTRDGNVMEVVVQVQINDGELLINGTVEGELGGVEISKPLSTSAAETLTKLLDSSRPQIQSQSTTDEPTIRSSTPLSIPPSRSLTPTPSSALAPAPAPAPARDPTSTTDSDAHDTGVAIVQSSPAILHSIALPRQAISKRMPTCEASAQTVEIDDGTEASFEEYQDGNKTQREDIHIRRRKASEASLTSMMSMTSNATEIIWIGSVSGPSQNWDERKKGTNELREKKSERNRRASSITVDWEKIKQEVCDVSERARGVAVIHDIVITTIYDCKPTMDVEGIPLGTSVAIQELTITDELLTPVHATSPVVDVLSTLAEGTSSGDGQEVDGCSDASSLHTSAGNAKLETIGDTSEGESEDDREPKTSLAIQEPTTTDELLTPVHEISPVIDVLSTLAEGTSSGDRQEVDGCSDASSLHTSVRDAGLETNSSDESEGDREQNEAKRIVEVGENDNSSFDSVTVDNERRTPILSKLTTSFTHQEGQIEDQQSQEVLEISPGRVLEAVKEEQENQDEISPNEEKPVVPQSPPPKVEFSLPTDISTLDLKFDFGLPSGPSSPTTINLSPPSSRPQSRQSRPPSRHRNSSLSWSTTPPPVPPRSPHRKSMPSMNANFHRSSQNRLSQMLDFGESFLSRSVEGDSGNEAIWERRRGEVMEPLAGDLAPLPGCLQGGSLCGEGVVGSWVSTGEFGVGNPRPGVRRFSSLRTM